MDGGRVHRRIDGSSKSLPEPETPEREGAKVPGSVMTPSLERLEAVARIDVDEDGDFTPVGCMVHGAGATGTFVPGSIDALPRMCHSRFQRRVAYPGHSRPGFIEVGNTSRPRSRTLPEYPGRSCPGFIEA